MRDLEWLKEEVDYVRSVVSMIGRGNTVADGITAIENIIKELDQVEQLETPVVPQWYVDWFEKRGYEMSLYGILNYLYADRKKETEKWAMKLENGHAELQILLAGICDKGTGSYTVEEKKRYEVRGNNGLALLLKDDNGVREPRSTSDIFHISYELTEQEIKSYDERYWAFAIPVEELDL